MNFMRIVLKWDKDMGDKGTYVCSVGFDNLPSGEYTTSEFPAVHLPFNKQNDEERSDDQMNISPLWSLFKPVSCFCGSWPTHIGDLG